MFKSYNLFSTIATVSPSSGNFLQSCDAARVEQDDDNDNDNDNEKGRDDDNDNNDYNNDEGTVWYTSPH